MVSLLDREGALSRGTRRRVRAVIRVDLHVHPGSSRPGVGGSHGGSLVVRVRARAVDGAATSEVLSRIADAFGVRSAQVTLVRGATSRRKVVAIEGESVDLSRLLEALFDAD